MASKRVVPSLIARAIAPRIVTRCLHIQPSFATKTTSKASIIRPASTQLRIQRRQESNAASDSSRIYSFEDVKALSESPSPSRILIDTREPGELQDSGRIPGAINIPISSNPDAFFLTEEDFEDRFGVAQPSKDSELVMYCKAGVRSRAAAKLASQGGWETVGEFPGSWMEWMNKGGKVERS